MSDVIHVSWPHQKRSRKDLPSLCIPASKSELNRLLILAALREGRTVIRGTSHCEDVQKLINALIILGLPISRTVDGFVVEKGGLGVLGQGRSSIVLDCGSGGTTLRFLMAICSLLPLKTELLASSQLLKRPFEEWIKVLSQMGAQVEKTSRGFQIKNSGEGVCPSNLRVPMERSSQFASAIALAASGLQKEITIQTGNSKVSEPYWLMTLELLRQVHATVKIKKEETVIQPAPSGARQKALELVAEADASSAAVWLASGALGWSVKISNYPQTKRQADCEFSSLLFEFGCKVKKDKDGIYSTAARHEFQKGFQKGSQKRNINLRHSPDLAPILAVLGALLKGETEITGAKHLRYKESNRIEDLATFLEKVGITLFPKSDGFVIKGDQIPRSGIVNPHGDHRLAMAASLLASRTSKIGIEMPNVVDKSYPEFWQHAKEVGWKIEN